MKHSLLRWILAARCLVTFAGVAPGASADQGKGKGQAKQAQPQDNKNKDKDTGPLVPARGR